MVLKSPILCFPWFKVGPNSANGSLQCLCTHLSAFGGDFLVAPNPIDFNKVWDAFSNILESKNFLVLGTVCVMLGLYVIAAVFARRADRSDSQKVSIIRMKSYGCKLGRQPVFSYWRVNTTKMLVKVPEASIKLF